MKKFEGIVVSTGMKNTVVVEIFRRTPHPLYRKLIKRSKKYNVDSVGFENVNVGATVKIVETRPISKNKYFKISEIVGLKTAKISKKEIIKDEESGVKESKLEVVKTSKTAKKTTKKESK